jgi:hypothetical protein
MAGRLSLDPDSTISMAVYSPQTQSNQEFCRIESSVYENNPNWSTSVSIIYTFGVIQPITIKIQNSQNESLHSFSSTLGALLRSESTSFSLRGNPSETLRIISKVSKSQQELVNMHLRAHNVDKMDFFGKSDPYFMLFKSNNGSWSQVYKSEVIKKTLDPIWKPFQIPLSTLCEGNVESPVKFEVWDWDRGTKDDFIGLSEAKVIQLSNPNCRLELINPSKQKKKKKYLNSGILEITSFEVLKKHSMVDFLQSGLKLNLLIGVDFTSSNQDFSLPTSLHNLQCENFYEKMITSVGSVFSQYDPQQLFALFGFGGEPQWLRRVDHSFSLNGLEDSPFVQGLENLVETYKKAVPRVRLAGPTLGGPLISTANYISSNFENDKTYYVLVVIIDSPVNDLYQTLGNLVQSSFLPLTVIFVGIGNDNFSTMAPVLDFPLSDESGKRSIRKNVHFGELKTFNNSAEKLVEELLKDVPGEIEEFMEFIRFKP